ncbi:MAG: hypothetical protein HC905_03575 [Bacteroidales bacterium]|nr:hypothetical protein [Bacteroidales bacterium]
MVINRFDEWLKELSIPGENKNTTEEVNPAFISDENIRITPDKSLYKTREKVSVNIEVNPAIENISISVKTLNSQTRHQKKMQIIFQLIC